MFVCRLLLVTAFIGAVSFSNVWLFYTCPISECYRLSAKYSWKWYFNYKYFNIRDNADIFVQILRNFFFFGGEGGPGDCQFLSICKDCLLLVEVMKEKWGITVCKPVAVAAGTWPTFRFFIFSTPSASSSHVDIFIPSDFLFCIEKGTKNGIERRHTVSLQSNDHIDKSNL